MKVVIVDDELPSIILMKMLMSKNEYLEVIGEFTNSLKALEYIKENVPDVIFVDVEMPQMTGVELATEVMHFNSNIQIIFVTAFEKYALKAFDVNAVNYILKPITEETLNITVTRLLKSYNCREQNFSYQQEINKIVTLGEYTVFGNLSGEKVQWATAKGKELFAYFVLQRGKEVDKWTLCDILFPEMITKKAEHNLHSTISRLKAALKNIGIENIISCVKGNYKIDMSMFSCDIWEWREWIENNPIITKDNLSYYEKALSLYAGDLFAPENYVWALPEQERINKEFINSMKKVATYFMNRDNYKKAEVYLLECVKLDPYDEDIVELLMKTYYFTGKRFEMKKVYNQLEDILKEELNVKPSESLQNIYREMRVNNLRKI